MGIQREATHRNRYNRRTNFDNSRFDYGNMDYGRNQVSPCDLTVSTEEPCPSPRKDHFKIESAAMSMPSRPATPADAGKPSYPPSEASDRSSTTAESPKSYDGPAPTGEEHHVDAVFEPVYEEHRRKGWNTGRKRTSKKSKNAGKYKTKRQARCRSNARSQKKKRRTKKQKDKRRKAE